MIEGGIREQTQQVLKNLSAILQDQSLTFQDVVKTTVFLTDLEKFAEMNAIYAEHFRANFPARSTIQVAALPRGVRPDRRGAPAAAPCHG